MKWHVVVFLKKKQSVRVYGVDAGSSPAAARSVQLQNMLT